MTTSKRKSVPKGTEKKAWDKPRLRAVVPASHTRGGTLGTGQPDDAWYSLS